MKNNHYRFRLEAGIAIGPILFIIALLAVISIAVTSSGNFSTTTITPDRVSNLIRSQAQLIRSKILECYTNGFERGDLSDRYPASTGNGTEVEDLDCPSYVSGQQNLWAGQAPTSLPPAPGGFGPWYYVNAGKSGGRCIRIEPATPTDAGIRGGLAQAATAFTANELVYDGGGSSQRFIIWITPPTGTPSTDCQS